MSVDIVKQLDRAKRFVEKNRIDEAIDAYQGVLADFPNHMESIQALGDLYARQNQVDRAAYYYGMLFDKFAGSRDEAKALALYTRFLKPSHQPPERVARYALLLQKQNKTEESIEQFTSAALAFELSGKDEEALACFVRVSELDPDDAERHLAVAQRAEQLENVATATRAYLRAAQLTAEDPAALELFAKAHELSPSDRSATLLYAKTLLRVGDPAHAASLMAELSDEEQDTPFLETYAETLIRSGRLDTAREVIDRLFAEGAVPVEKGMNLVVEYLRAGQDENAVGLLDIFQKSMLPARRETQFASSVDQIVAQFPKSLRLAQFWAAMYSELSRESQFFDALVLLFDLSLANSQLESACDTLEKLVEIDPYDFRNQKRMDQLQGRADESFLSRLRSRLTNAATHGTKAPPSERPAGSVGEPSPALLEDVHASHTLEDLLVQAEIFVQYSLQSKAIERLQRIVELFPVEQENNERLQSLFQAVHWWPGAEAAQAGASQTQHETPHEVFPEEPAAVPSPYAPETMRDLAKISEINQSVFRQPSPRAMLSVAVNEVGSYMRASRCVALVGSPGQPAQMASEYCAPGVEPSPGGQIVRLIAMLERASPDALGGLPLEAAAAPLLREMGMETALGIQLTDPETRTSSGMLIVGFAAPHIWKTNETYFLQSIGDQMLLCVHHTRLRSLVRTLAVADEKTGLLARSSYLDCLLNESNRARNQGIPLALALLQIDGGQELARQHGDAPFERYMETVARTVHSIVRQTDVSVKYTSWAVAFILPDTPLAGARTLAEKLRKAAGNVRAPWDNLHLTTSVAIAEANVRHDFDNEDIVTELINRAESGLEEARRQGGNAVVALELQPV